MTAAPAPALSEGTFTLCVVLILLVPLAGAGVALVNTGLGRVRSAAHTMLASLSVLGVAALAYFVCGFAWQGFPGLAAHSFTMAGRRWDWIGAAPFFLRGLPLDGSPASLAVLLGMMSVGLAAIIPLGSGSDRWRLGSSCASTALLAGFVYPLFTHWVWGGGWLAQLGVNYGLGHGFVDAGGGGSIQVVGGLSALAIAWILGPRRGKYAHDGMPSAIPGHNTILVLFACLLGLLGWLGLNGAGAILFNGAEAGRIVLIAVNTTLSAVTGALASIVVTRIRFTRPDASLAANGWFGGLVASSASCAFVAPAESVIIGLVAGAVVTLSIEWFELKLGVDDPVGVVSVHALGGLWGIVAVGLFAGFPERAAGQWLAQVVGVATLVGFVLPVVYGLNWALNRISPQRVAVEGERQGMDLYELGAGAYPEFLTHNEEFLQR